MPRASAKESKAMKNAQEGTKASRVEKESSADSPSSFPELTNGRGEVVSYAEIEAQWARAKRGLGYTLEGKTSSPLSKFRLQVLSECAAIPRGRLSTYAGIAKVIGCGSSQAVGQALKNNPFSPVVPCHRVVKTDLSIGGFNGATGLKAPEILRKVSHLKSEGVFYTMDKKGKLVLQNTSVVL